MDSLIASFDDAILQSIYNLADTLKCTPLDVLNFILRAGTVMSVIFGMLLMIFFDYFMRPVGLHIVDRLSDGIFAVFRWLRSRRKKDR